MIKFKRISSLEYEVTETRGYAKIISFVKMDSAKHILSDVKKKFKRENRIEV